MPFMLLTLAVILVVAVAAYFQTSPRMEDPRPVLVFNIATLLLSVPAAISVGGWLYADAIARRPGETGMAIYLAIMAGGTAALLVIAVGGLVRNFGLFPLSRRLKK
jgi:hypothetical protein